MQFSKSNDHNHNTLQRQLKYVHEHALPSKIFNSYCLTLLSPVNLLLSEPLTFIYPAGTREIKLTTKLGPVESIWHVLSSLRETSLLR